MTMAENIHNQFNNSVFNNPVFQSGGVAGKLEHVLVAAGAGVPDSFRGRERELEDIRTLLTTRQSALALVNAEGGMGKTTLAAKYWQMYEKDYQHVAWLFCEKGILTALRDQLPVPLGLVETLNQYADKPDKQVQVIKNAMANLPKDCLLVLDNANEPAHIDGFLQMMTGLGWHVLITSRCSDLLPDAEYRISSLPPEQAKDLFRSNYTEDTPEFEPLLDRFLVAVGYNTLCIEIFSKNLREGNPLGYTFEKFLGQLETQGLFLGENSFEIKSDYARQVVGETVSVTDRIIDALYHLDTLDQAETDLLTTFALLPAENHAILVLKELIAAESPAQLKRALDALARKGWIAANAGTYRISPVVQKIVLHRNKERLWELGAPVVERLNGIFENEGFHSKNITTAAPFAELVFGLVDNLNTGANELADLYHGLWVYYNANGSLAKSLDTVERSCTYCNRFDLKFYLATSYEKLGETHSALGNLDRALAYFEKYNQLEKELYDSYPQNISFKNGLAISYSKLGSTHSALGNLDRALTYFEQYNQLEKELYDSYPQNVSFKNGLAVSSQYLGDTHSVLGNLDRALTYFQQYNQLEKELYEAYPQNVEFKNFLAISCQFLGGTHSALGNLDRALTYFEQYNQLKKELYEAYPQNVTFKNGLAISNYKLGEINCDHLSDRPKAKAWFQQAEALWLELVRDAPQYAQFQQFLGIVQQDLAALE